MNTNCFFISAIGEENSPERINSDKVLKYLVEPIMNSIGFDVIRADSICGPTEIVKDIYEHLDVDEIVIADVSFINPNVFFEIGYRFKNKNMPILIQNINISKQIPFDLKGYRHLFYTLDIDKIENEKKALYKFSDFFESPDSNIKFDKDGNKYKIIAIPINES